MPKSTGIGWTTFSVGDGTGSLTVIKQGVTNLDFSTPRPMQDTTSIDVAAYERLLLIADFSINLAMNFDDAIPSAGVAGPHWVFRTLNQGTSRAQNLTVNGSTLNLTGVLYTDYTVKRDNNGALAATATGVLADGSVPTWS